MKRPYLLLLTPAPVTWCPPAGVAAGTLSSGADDPVLSDSVLHNALPASPQLQVLLTWLAPLTQPPPATLQHFAHQQHLPLVWCLPECDTVEDAQIAVGQQAAVYAMVPASAPAAQWQQLCLQWNHYDRQLSAICHSRCHNNDATSYQALGRLSAMLTHEINNPSCYAMANLSLARQLLSALTPASGADTPAVTLTPQQQERLQVLIDESYEGLERIITIAQQFGLFSRASQQPAEWCDLQTVLHKAWHSVQLAQQADSAILCLDWALPAGQPVRIHRQLLQQALINILTNSVQAAQKDRPLRVSIKARPEATHLSLTLSDNGQGMDAATLARLFDPFYSTKPMGQGCGLGMTIVQQAIRYHHGNIQVASHAGQGTTVTLQLPGVLSSQPSAAHTMSTEGRALHDDLLVS